MYMKTAGMCESKLKSCFDYIHNIFPIGSISAQMAVKLNSSLNFPIGKRFLTQNILVT